QTRLVVAIASVRGDDRCCTQDRLASRVGNWEIHAVSGLHRLSRSAITLVFVSLATGASSISRADCHRMFAATDASLTLAPSSTLCSRFAATVRSGTR